MGNFPAQDETAFLCTGPGHTAAFQKFRYSAARLVGCEDPTKPEDDTMSDQEWQEVERQWLEVQKTVDVVIANLGRLTTVFVA